MGVKCGCQVWVPSAQWSVGSSMGRCVWQRCKHEVEREWRKLATKYSLYQVGCPSAVLTSTTVSRSADGLDRPSAVLKWSMVTDMLLSTCGGGAQWGGWGQGRGRGEGLSDRKGTANREGERQGRCLGNSAAQRGSRQ